MAAYCNNVLLFYADVFQFQFLYPFILDPIWMETSVEKQDAQALSTTSQVFNSVTAVAHESQMINEKSEDAELKTSSVISVLSTKEMQPYSVDVFHKVWFKLSVVKLTGMF